MRKNMKRQILAVIISIVLCLQLAPVYAHAVDTSNLYGVWEGTYTGHRSNGTPIERELRLDIDYVSNGKFEGIATIDGGSNGRYFFDGTISEDGYIQFKGVDWIDNPNDFGFGAFSGVYNESANRMSGNVDGESDRLFLFVKTSGAYNSMRVDLNSIPREWDGEYDGYSGSTVVRRTYEIHIQSIESDGTIRGNAIFSPSEKADAVYGRNGSYYFSGKINARYGKIALQGYEWIEYPVGTEDNWSFVSLEGYFDLSSEAKIHGSSDHGIWEMTAINYDSINLISGFTLGRDNNHFVHTSSASWDGAGFVGVKDYTIDDAYFQALTRNSSKGEKNRIKKDMQEKWGGSCYGIAMSMGLLYEGYIGINDLTNASGEGSYYSLSYPYKDRKFLNMINYYQLSQGLENGGKKSAAVSASYNNWIFTGLVNWINGYDSLPVFLKKMVNYCASDHVELLGFSTKDSGHAVLITGCEFDSASDTYRVEIYDENCISSPYSIGEFSYMTVAKDFSSFSYTDSNGDLIDNNTYASIFFLDWSSLGSVVAPTSSDYSDHTRISFPMGQEFRIVNASGQYLEYDGSVFKGDMPVYGIDTADFDTGSRFTIETSNTDVLTVSDIGSEIDIEAYSDADYMAFKGVSIDGAVMDMDGGIALSGDNYQFEAYISTAQVAAGENGLISLAANATSDVELTAVGATVSVTSDTEVTNVSTGSYIGADASIRQYTDTGTSFTIEDDATIDGAIEITAGTEDVHFPRTKTYVQGQFTDVSSNNWFAGSVAEAYELGLMVGVSDTVFDPQGDVTIAQAVTMAARIHSIYSTGTEDMGQSAGGAWYQPYLDYAYHNGIINYAYYTCDVTQKATRAQFAEIFAHSLPDVALRAKNSVADNAIPDVSMASPFAEHVYKLYRAGILSGNDAIGTFSPASNITRAEAAALVSRMAESDNRVSVTLT